MNRRNDSNVKTLINQADIDALGMMGMRYIVRLEQGSLEEITKDPSTLHLIEVNQAYQLALAPGPRKKLRQAVIGAYRTRLKAYDVLRKQAEVFIDDTDETPSDNALLVWQAVDAYGNGFRHKRLSEQHTSYSNIVKELAKPEVVEAATALTLTKMVEKLASAHVAYEKAQDEWVKFKYSHAVPSHLKEALAKALKMSIDAMRNKINFDTTGTFTELYADLVGHIREAYRIRREEKENDSKQDDVPPELKDEDSNPSAA